MAMPRFKRIAHHQYIGGFATDALGHVDEIEDLLYDVVKSMSDLSSTDSAYEQNEADALKKMKKASQLTRDLATYMDRAMAAVGHEGYTWKT